jgi:hypothetical protein
MEEGYALAEAGLRRELAAVYPAMLARCEARREFMRHTLGMDLDASVLPLANTAGLIAPYLLNPSRILAL